MRFVHTADTHLGFEVMKTVPSHERGRQRRADWIFENFVAVVNHAMEVDADLFIHSGDLFNKYYIPRERLDDLVKPLLDLEKGGIPVLIIPGNHERSEFPFDLFHGAKGVFVFDRPKSISLTLDGYRIGVAGFPFIREDSRRTFLKALHETAYEEMRSDLNILVTHQAFDGARVGPGDFTFRPTRSDTVARAILPEDFSYIAAGHIHRYQILHHPSMPGLPLVYPGSIQRISFAEMDEEKGFVEVAYLHGRFETSFIPLPVWDMEMVEIEAAGRPSKDVEEAVRAQFWRFGEEIVIRFNLTGGERTSDYPDINLEKLRAEMPPVLECQFALKVGNRWIKR